MSTPLPLSLEILKQACNGNPPFVPKFRFFYGKTPFSQWHPSQFIVDEQKYLNAEQWMMSEKARVFGDQDTRAQILAKSDPAQIKGLGRQVQGFQKSVWDQVCFDLVVQGNRAKFGQDPTLRDLLLMTEGEILVEASPSDRIWGIGLSKQDPRIQDPNQWLGTNLLGFALVKVRDILKKGNWPTF